MAETIKIPKPTPQEEYAWTSAGVGEWRLVWDKVGRKWIVKKVKNVSSTDITIQKWNAGEKSYTVTKSGGDKIPSEFEAKTKQAEDPLGIYVEKYGLVLVTDPNTKKTELKGFSIDPKTGKSTTTPVNYYLYLDSKNQIQLSSNYDEIKSRAIKDLKDSGKLNEVFQNLYNKKIISKATYDSKNLSASDFNSALLGAIEGYSRLVIGNREYGISKTASSFLDYIKGLSGKGGTGDVNAPRRDINLVDRDVIRALIEDIYMENNMQLPDDPSVIESKVNKYMKQIESGVLTTYSKNKAGEIVSKSTPGFSESQVRAEVGKEIPKELPIDYQRAQSLNFLSFLSQMERD